ncbi:Inositol-1-monophosphatase [Rickettsiales bacterium Ac37b]|nr:Inositol-1-monophosphatase [Rickettsiales bacterium Ac37b]
MNNYTANINVMIGATRKASRRLLRDFGEVNQLQVSRKGTDKFVDIAAINAEKIIVEELKRARPSYNVLLHDRQIIHDEKCEFQWIINALDGRVNFLHASPFFCISIALEKVTSNNKEVIASVIDMPILGETYFAEKGQGAWLEKHMDTTRGRYKLRVSNRENFDNSVLAINNIEQTMVNKLNDFIKHNISIRVTGSVGLNLAYVAAGRYDIAIDKDESCNIMAGILLLREAGGEFCNIGHNVIATNNSLYKSFESIMSK